MTLLQYPGITQIEERRQREYVAGNRNSIFEIRDALGVPSNVNNVIKRLRNRVAWRIRGSRVARNERDRTERAKIEAADIEVASGKKSLVVGNSGALKAVNE